MTNEYVDEEIQRERVLELWRKKLEKINVCKL